MITQKKKIDNYTVFLDRKLGEGSFGKVYIGEQDKTGLKVAVKMLDKKTIDKDEYIKSALLAEIAILKTLKSENIVGFLDVMESANYYYLVQEFCDGGDLRGLIKKRGSLPEAEAVSILTQVCNGFVEILKEGVIHRDLKPENILISKGVMKICDFGFSKKSTNKRLKHKTIVGTPLYMSLEILKGQPYTSKCDIWALGFIFYELLHGVTPWDAESEYQLIENITHQPLKFPRGDLSPTTRDFLTRCLKPYEKDRIGWDELLRHDIFKGFFTAYVKKEHEFENKFKSLMGQIRFRINSQNIDLERLFERHGYQRNTELNFELFEAFLKTIDATLTSEEERYMFEKLDTNDSDSISLSELQDAMTANNIPMKSNYRPAERKDSITSDVSANDGPSSEKRRFIELKIIAAFNRLSQKMTKNHISLRQVFDAYDVNKDGDITIKEFKRIMMKLDETLTDEEVQIAFSFVDVDNSQSIVFQELFEYFCKCTGEPVNDYMFSKANKSTK